MSTNHSRPLPNSYVKIETTANARVVFSTASFSETDEETAALEEKIGQRIDQILELDKGNMQLQAERDRETTSFRS